MMQREPGAPESLFSEAPYEYKDGVQHVKPKARRNL